MIERKKEQADHGLTIKIPLDIRRLLSYSGANSFPRSLFLFIFLTTPRSYDTDAALQSGGT